MNTAAIVWIAVNLWFGSLRVPVEMPQSAAAAYEAYRLRVEAEELRHLVIRYAERRKCASIPRQNEGRAGL